jgi:hypothetical protein
MFPVTGPPVLVEASRAQIVVGPHDPVAVWVREVLKPEDWLKETSTPVGAAMTVWLVVLSPETV